MASFQDIVENAGSTFADETPFYFVDVWGDHYWDDPNRLVLQDEDSPFRSTSGRVYLIVKPEWEARIRVRTNNWGAFKEDDFTAATRAAYDMRFDTPFLATGQWKSSMTFTMRGGSMLAVAVDGDKETWHTRGSTFDWESRRRNAPQPQFVLSFRGNKYKNNGMLLSLSAPYGDYSSTEVRNWRWDALDDDTRIDLVSYNKAPAGIDGEPQEIVPTVGDVISEEIPTYADPQEWGNQVRVDSGTDADGNPWSVSIRENLIENAWYIVVDGTYEDDLSFSNEDSDGYEDALAQARLIAKARREAAKVKSDDVNPNLTPTLAGIGLGAGIAVVGLLVLIILARRG
jgi:hypothetical protein